MNRCLAGTHRWAGRSLGMGFKCPAQAQHSWLSRKGHHQRLSPCAALLCVLSRLPVLWPCLCSKNYTGKPFNPKRKRPLGWLLRSFESPNTLRSQGAGLLLSHRWSGPPAPRTFSSSPSRPSAALSSAQCEGWYSEAGRCPRRGGQETASDVPEHCAPFL